MRTAALLALVVATFACGAEPAPRPASDAASAPDASEAALDAPDPCAGVSCLPGSVCSFGACILAPVDASAPDVAVETDPGCPASAPASCVSPGFGPGCWNLSTSNGMVPARHCGACNRECPAAAPECIGGRCTGAAADAGRD